MKPFEIQPASAFGLSDEGAWAGVEMAEYQIAPGESNSMLTVLARSPKRYRMTLDGDIPRPPSTHDQELGTMIHGAINEGQEPAFWIRPDSYSAPESAKKDAAIIDKPWNMNANFCKGWYADHSDKPILTAYEAMMLNSVINCALLDPRAMKLMNGATGEVSARARNDDESAPYLLRCRFDMLGQDEAGYYWLELKSTRDASTHAFSREILKRNYFVQCAQQRRILRKLTGDDGVRCFLLAAEKDAAIPRVNVRQLQPAAMDLGDKIVDERLALLAKCRLANSWPALADEEGGENIPFISLPDYAMGGSVDDLAGLTEIDGDEEKEK